MPLSCGIVGLPNVGKSTLFNALTATAAAEAANFPFATIEPNIGRVSVPDSRLHRLAALARSAKVIPTQLEFVDIAGLVRGASKGEGLGNQFLANIREVDAILHVVRCFEDTQIHHVAGRVDPLDDIETVETELLLADMESLVKRKAMLEKKGKSKDKEALKNLDMIAAALSLLEAGTPARGLVADLEGEDLLVFQRLGLLTAKPVFYVCNVGEESLQEGDVLSHEVESYAQARGIKTISIMANLEAEIAQLEDEEEKKTFLEDLGLAETGLSKVIRLAYDLLDLITFFTVGPKETRAWPIRRGALAPEAAGLIHTDFARGFIKAETISYADYEAMGSEQKAKEAGKVRQEGKTYEVQDGDIFHFRFNV